MDNGKIRIQDTFNVDKDFTTVGFADIIPGLQATADRLVDISYKNRNIRGRTDEGGIKIDVEIKGENIKKDYEKNRDKLRQQRQQNIEPESRPEMRSEAEMETSYEKARKGIPSLPPFSELTSDIKPPDNIPEPNEPGWTYQEYMDMLNAIGDKAAAASLPITNEILEYGPGGTKTGQVPIGLVDAQEAITIARTNAEAALTAAWERYNKIPEPSGYGTDPSRDTETEARPVRGGQGGRRLGSTTQRQGGAFNPSSIGFDRDDTSFSKKKKKNVRGSGARGGRKGRVNESNTFSKIKEFRNKY